MSGLCGGDDELGLREPLAQPADDLLLPGGVHVQVDLIDQHDAGLRHRLAESR
jgi:hypothetical protein